jgi:hypothetical protein
MKIYMHFCVHLKFNLRFGVNIFGINIIEENKTQFMPSMQLGLLLVSKHMSLICYYYFF